MIYSGIKILQIENRVIKDILKIIEKNHSVEIFIGVVKFFENQKLILIFVLQIYFNNLIFSFHVKYNNYI